MLKTSLIYGCLLAAGALGLQWVQLQYLVRVHPAEIYLALIAAAFLGLGIWVGARLGRRPPVAFEANTRVQASLGIRGRELEVLQLLAAGRSNLEKVIAETQQFARRYANPFFRMPITFLEMFPVGVIISLISAAVLRNSRVLPARQLD
jgi:hypothetical protein